jgi:hypothetical protein
MQVEVILNGSERTSRFELTISTTDDMLNSSWLGPGSGVVTVVILMRRRQDIDNTILLEGFADHVSFDPVNRLARVQGRDYSSVLVSTSYQDSFCNQTASEIANRIAERHGFSANIAETTTMVGSYQSGNYNKVLLNAHSRVSTEWDLLVKLAKAEAFEMFVDGKILVFAPLSALEQNYITIGTNDIESVRFNRSCPLSGQTRFVVKSWNCWLNQIMTSTTVQSSDGLPSVSNGFSNDPGTEFALIRPNLTSQGSEQLAQRYLDALHDDALTAEIVMPGELSLRPLDIITFGGTIAGFGTDYVIKSVRRHFSFTKGLVQYIHAKADSANIAPSTMPGI